MIEQISRLVDGKDLDALQARGAMDEIMSGKATPAQIAGFLTALRIKGETVTEITACAEVMREKAEKLTASGDLLDIVGTGGDCAFTFNISTISAVVAAAAGVKVAKHGNRSVSSKCGAADLLEALHVNLNITPEQNAAVLHRTGICFMFAPVYHKSMKYAGGPRRELGIRTVFNILGPLTNPANANLQVLGVYDAALLEPLAHVLSNLGVKRALAVCGGTDGRSIDELSLCGETKVCELSDGETRCYTLMAKDFGLEPCKLSDITGGGPSENAEIAKRIFAGEHGHKRDVAVMNTAAALYVAQKAKTFREGAETAQKIIDTGRAAAKLREFVAATNSF